MKLLSAVPVKLGRPNLGTLLEETERGLRGSATTFVRRKKRHWVHVKYAGWITWDMSKGSLLTVQIHSKKPDSER